MKLHLGFWVPTLGLCIFGCGGGGGGTGSSSSSASPSYLNVVLTSPERGDADIQTTQELAVVFDRKVNGSTLSGNIKVEDANGVEVPGTYSLDSSGYQVHFTPSGPMEAGKTYRLHISPGVKDSSGTPLYVNFLTAFDTVSNFQATLFPAHGSYQVPTNAAVAVRFTKPVDPNSVSTASLRIEDPNGSIVPGSFEFQSSDHVVVFRPTGSLAGSSNHLLRVIGGEAGVRGAQGEQLSGNSTSLYQTAAGADYTTPTVVVSIAEIPSGMSSNLTIPSYGSELSISFSDGYTGYLNPGSLSLTTNVAIGDYAAGENLLEVFPTVSLTSNLLRVRIPKEVEISGSNISFVARASDLSGNPGISSSFNCKVKAATSDNVPFEHVQVCWARFDMNRDGSNGQDFEEDLFIYGLIADGDPLGLNGYVRDLVEEGIIDTANQLFKTTTFGRVLFTRSAPESKIYSKMAIGGFDPSSSSDEIDGPSTGVLGRAYFDQLNTDYNNDNTVLNPALGVFPREMFRAYNQGGIGDVLFNSTFAGLSPELGGTPVGSHYLDSVILDPNFVYATAPLEQRSRYTTVFTAIQRFSKVIGFLLSHEMGHSVGLTPTVLNGTNYHNAQGSATDVMLSAVSFTSISVLDVKFRPLNLAYLMHWIIIG